MVRVTKIGDIIKIKVKETLNDKIELPFEVYRIDNLTGIVHMRSSITPDALDSLLEQEIVKIEDK